MKPDVKQLDRGLVRDTALIPPVVEENPRGSSAFLLICDHYGRLIPASLGDLGVSESERRRHIGWDIGIAGVATHLAALLDAAMIAQRYSRLVIDCNRPPGVPSSIPEISEATAIPGNEALAPDQREERRALIFEPYHARISEVLDARHAAGEATMLLALHSFTPVYAGVERPWHVGALYHRDDRLPTRLLAALRAEGDLVVGDNEPYAVDDATDYTIPVHGERRGLLHTGIEIRQDLIADEAGQRLWAQRLARIFTALDGELHPKLTGG
jgi:predicted N-formylglutamate amidohydrolase